MPSTHTTASYLLGHDPAEIQRLEHQGAILAPATTALLTMAGIRPGMRVLDLGTGVGDVALLAAELVGPHGTVIGIDRSADALATARARAKNRAASNVHFANADVRDYRDSEPFDAVLGRLVLLYMPDPVEVICHHAAALRAGGVVLAMEYDMPSARAVPAGPTATTATRWVTDAFERAGLDPQLGTRLGTHVLPAAGLDPVTAIGIQLFLPPAVGARMLAGIVRTMLPVIERTGVATAAEVDVTTLDTRLADELSERAARFALPPLVGAWATIG